MHTVLRTRALFVIGLISFLVPPSANALLVGANNGVIEFSATTVGAPRAGAPLFGLDGELIGPGGGFPDFVAAILPTQTIGPGPIAPGLAAVANPAVIDGGQFGAGAMTVRAIGFANGGGVFWGPGGVSDAATNGIASIVDSSGTVTLINAGPLPFVGIGGGFLSIRGVLGAPGEYVAASLTGNVGGVPFIPIVIAADGPGGALDSVLLAGTASAFNPGAGGLDFTAWGVSLIGVPFVIPAGGNITLGGTLTLAADPNSYTDLIPLPLIAPRPDFGVAAVPEPSSVMLCLLGLVLLVQFVKRAAPSPKASS